MNPEERSLLERTLKLSEENNKILKSLRRVARWTSFWGFVQFLLVVVPLAALYIYLQPYLGTLNHLMAQAQTALSTFGR